MKSWWLGQLINVIFAVVLYLAGYPFVAASFILGAVVHIVPHAFLGWRMFKHHGASQAAAITRGFYAGVLGKWLLTIAIFSLVYTQPWLQPVAFMLGFVGATLLTWVLTSRMTTKTVVQ